MTLLRTATPDEVRAKAACAVDRSTLLDAQTMLDAIERDGDPAVLEFARRFDSLQPGEPVLWSSEELCHARSRLADDQRRLLERIAERIRVFAQGQRRALADLELPIPGGAAGHRFTPVRAAGCYAPGGRYPLPSSVLMTVIPARVAGVHSVIVASPRPGRLTLAAAAIAGADAVLSLGGVQAIGAMAFGRLGAPVCDVIVGPGNRWVTAAKQCVSSRVGIDMLAGPSELVVFADDSASPEVVASDLIAQAEHDPDASVSLVTTSPALHPEVEFSLARRLERLPTSNVARSALANGVVCIVRSDDEGVEVCNRLAPEHLEIIHRRAIDLAPRLDRCGAIFIGSGAAEVIGDYGAGPNHTLPTGGTSGHRAGLSVLNFLKATTWIRIDDAAGARPLYLDAAACARLESLEGHARSAESRLTYDADSARA